MNAEEITKEFERSMASIDQKEYQEMFSAFLQARGITPPGLPDGSGDRNRTPSMRAAESETGFSWELVGFVFGVAVAIGALVVLVLVLIALMNFLVANWLPLALLTVVGCGGAAGVLHVRSL